MPARSSRFKPPAAAQPTAKKTTGGKKKSSADKDSEEDLNKPLALVLYEEHKELGVVRRESIHPKDAKLLSVCDAPDPLDFPSTSTALYKALVIAFGYNSDYLYALHVNQDGCIIPNVDTSKAENLKLLAKKKNAERAAERAAQAEGLEKLRQKVLTLAPLSQSLAPNMDVTSEDSTLSDGSQERSHNTQDSNNLSMSQSSLDQPTSPSVSLQESSCIGEPAVFSCPSLNPPSYYLGHPIIMGLPLPPQPSDLMFPHDMLLAAGILPSPGVLSLIERASMDNMYFLRDLCNEIMKSNSPSVTLNEPTAATMAENNEKLLSPAGEIMVPLVKGINCLITKTERLALPNVVPRGEADKRKKKPAESGAVFPQGMVNHLLNLLVPEEQLKKATYDTIPTSIHLGIHGFINYKLPKEEKILTEDYKRYVCEHIKNLNRKRDNEKVRQEQISKRKKKT